MHSSSFERLIPKQGWLQFTLIMVALSLLLAGQARAAEFEKPIRSVTASGKAERKVVPDEAHVNVNIGASNLKLETAKAEHDKKLRDVMAIAEKAGIDKAQVKTENSSVQPQYTWENNKQNFKGYRVQTQLDITVKKAESVGGLLEKLSAAGLESGSGQEYGNLLNVHYSISNPDKIRDEMLADAIKNARAKAENMAAAAGGSIGNAIQINEGSPPQFNYPVPMMARAMVAGSAKMESADASLPVGEQALNANVTVIFELK